MFGDLVSSRLIQGGLVFFVLVVGGSLLYYWYVHRTTIDELGPIPVTVESMENGSPQTNTVPVDFQTAGITNTPDEITDTPMGNENATLANETEGLDIADAFLPEDMVSEEKPSEEEAVVSPYGFGPYPEVPEDYPWVPPWLIEIVSNNIDQLPHELMHRVLIELWTQGNRNMIGGTVDKQTLMVYPTYPKTAYVTYGYVDLPDGTVRRYIKSIEGGNDLPHLSPEMAFRAEVPSGVNVLNKEDAGINPYSFLQLGEKR